MKEKEKTKGLVEILVGLYLKNQVEEFDIHVEHKTERTLIHIEGMIELAPGEEDRIRERLNLPRMDEYNAYDDLMGVEPMGSGIGTLAASCDLAEVEYVDKILTIELHRYHKNKEG